VDITYIIFVSIHSLTYQTSFHLICIQSSASLQPGQIPQSPATRQFASQKTNTTSDYHLNFSFFINLTKTLHIHLNPILLSFRTINVKLAPVTFITTWELHLREIWKAMFFFHVPFTWDVFLYWYNNTYLQSYNMFCLHYSKYCTIKE